MFDHKENTSQNYKSIMKYQHHYTVLEVPTFKRMWVVTIDKDMDQVGFSHTAREYCYNYFCTLSAESIEANPTYQQIMQHLQYTSCMQCGNYIHRCILSMDIYTDMPKKLQRDP